MRKRKRRGNRICIRRRRIRKMIRIKRKGEREGQGVERRI
jgi:hypothetical protein